MTVILKRVLQVFGISQWVTSYQGQQQFNLLNSNQIINMFRLPHRGSTSAMALIIVNIYGTIEMFEKNDPIHIRRNIIKRQERDSQCQVLSLLIIYNGGCKTLLQWSLSDNPKECYLNQARILEGH